MLDLLIMFLTISISVRFILSATLVVVVCKVLYIGQQCLPPERNLQVDPSLVFILFTYNNTPLLYQILRY